MRIDCAAAYQELENALSWVPSSTGEFHRIFSEGKTDTGRRIKLINYLHANLIRAFGPDGFESAWSRITYSELRRARFNTVGNWSDWQKASQAAFPYVRPLDFKPKRAPLIYRELPDVYHPEFSKDAEDFAAQLSASANDPALIGYLIMNEPTWGFSVLYPAEGILHNSPPCYTRDELARFLRSKYSNQQSLAQSWSMPVTFEKISRDKWEGKFSDRARTDLLEFSRRFTEHYFGTLSAACRKLDPHHLNLGIRWAGVPPEWAIQGMRSFDVFSQNCYQGTFPIAVAKRVDDFWVRHP